MPQHIANGLFTDLLLVIVHTVLYNTVFLVITNEAIPTIHQGGYSTHLSSHPEIRHVSIYIRHVSRDIVLFLGPL